MERSYVVAIFNPHHCIVSAFDTAGRGVFGKRDVNHFSILWAAADALHCDTSSARYSRSDSGLYPLRRMKEEAMWRIGHVDTVNLRSHMPTMKGRQPTSSLRGPSSFMVFIMVDVREYKPERSQGEKGPLRERPLLSLIYKISPCATRGRFCGGSRPRPIGTNTST